MKNYLQAASVSLKLKTIRSVFLFLTLSSLLLIAGPIFARQNPSPSPAPTPTPDVRPLATEQTIERENDGQSQHHYSIRLEAAQAIDVRVEQVGINVGVAFADPSENIILNINTRNRLGEVEELSLVAQASGEYQVIVFPFSDKAPGGTYRLRVTRPRAASETDRRRFSAFLAGNQAQALFLKRSNESFKQAIAKYQEALRLWQSLKDEYWEARMYHNLGWTSYWLEDYEASLKYLEQAVALRRKIGDRQGEAETLNALGSLYIWNGSNQPQKVVEYLESAQKIQNEIGSKVGAARSLYELAMYLQSTGDNQRARENFQRALEMFRAENEPLGEANSLTNLGTIFLFTGEYQNALDAFRRALPLHRTLKDPVNEAADLHKIGQCYFKLGDIATAHDYYEQALKIYEQLDYRPGKASVLTSLGSSEYRLGNYEKSLAHFEAVLRLHRDGKDRAGESNALLNLGRYFQQRGDFRRAVELLEQALPPARETGDVFTQASIHKSLGESYSSLGDKARAGETLKRALEQFRFFNDQSSTAETLYALAHLEAEAGNLNEASETAAEAVGIIESVRARVVNPQLRSSFLADQQDYYGLLISILMSRHEREPNAGFDRRALEISERARARTLFEILTESKADIRQGVDAALLERERILQQNINYKESKRLELLSGKYSPAQKTAAEREIDALLLEYAQTQEQIRAKSPAYAALTRPEPLALPQIQSLLAAEKDTVALVYRLRGKRSYLWAISADGVQSYALPGRETIEKEASAFYEQLKISFGRAARGQTQRSAVALGEILLAPVASLLLPNKRLVIVPDGKLHYIPFGSLIVPAATAGKNESPPTSSPPQKMLATENEIAYLPSISVLAELRRATQYKTRAPQTVAVFADAVYAANDERLLGAKARQTRTEKNTGAIEAENKNQLSSAAAAATAATRAGEEIDLKNLRRLANSRREAEQIAALAPPNLHFKALDFDASRQKVLATDLSRFRILHFAAHGLINNQRPELSGLALSLFDEKGAPQDGFLRAHEIYNLKLNAELVVLSACETALGKQVGGEGLMNMTRGFFYAGAPRVIVSLWKVEDAATAELMRHFYKALLQDKQTPAAALRTAQTQMSKNPRWSAPYYWAAFVLQGDWK